MTAIWKELLGVEGIGLDDNFFELGGHSLLATRILSRVRNTYGLPVPLQAVFDGPTIRQLSEYVDTVLWATAAPAANQSDLREELEF
jgi:acyl carrier protein